MGKVLTPDEIAGRLVRVREMIAAGEGRAEIAKALGMKRTSANRWLLLNNLKPASEERGVQWTPDVVAEVRRLKLTRTWAEIGAMYGVSAATVRFAVLRSDFPPAHVQRRDKSAPETQRLCLCGCGQRFGSTHPGERIRPECRPSWEARL